jgi:hypothetical protein
VSRGYIWVCLGCVSWVQIGRRLQTPYFTGGILIIFGRFWSILVNLGRFRGPFLTLFLIFPLRNTVYSHREPDPVLLVRREAFYGITSVRNRCQKIHFGNTRLHTFDRYFTLGRIQLFARLAVVRLASVRTGRPDAIRSLSVTVEGATPGL